MGCLKLTYYLDNEPKINTFSEELTLKRSSQTLRSSYLFGFNTQEKVDEISGEGNHNTAEFWEYDTRLGRRWNLDPKPNPSISNYACFELNPILNFDCKGDTPSVAESAAMIDFAYKQKDGYSGSISGSVIGGWKAQEAISNKYNGFKSVFFSRELKDGKFEYAYAFAGTDDWEDVITDCKMYIQPVAQMKMALNYAQKISNEHTGSELTFVGHSLGGWLATGSAYKTSRPAITFNAPGISAKNRIMYNLNKKATVTSYIADGEILSYALSPSGIKPSGNTIILKTNYSWIFYTSMKQRIENHKMISVEDLLIEQGYWKYRGQSIPVLSKPTSLDYIARPDNVRVIR
jgi:hypothetical protein